MQVTTPVRPQGHPAGVTAGQVPPREGDAEMEGKTTSGQGQVEKTIWRFVTGQAPSNLKKLRTCFSEKESIRADSIRHESHLFTARRPAPSF